MRMFPYFFRLLPASFVALIIVNEAHAFGALDPFRTEAIVPERSALLSPSGTFSPCQLKPADTVYSVFDVVDLALCHNPRTREIWASARVQAASVGVAQAAFLPNLDGRGVTTNFYDGDRRDERTQRTTSLTLSWLLYDFGARRANLENARQQLIAATSTLDATVQNVFLAALQAYYNTQAARAAVVATLESEKANQESFAAASTRYAVGAGTPADRLQAQTALSQAVLNRIRAEGALKNAYGILANIMGLDAHHVIQLDDIPEALPDDAFLQNVETLIDVARELRPDLRAAEAQVRAAQSNVNLARASGLPTLSLSAGPTWREMDGTVNHSSAIGFTLNIPFFSGFDTTYRVRTAEARVGVAQAQREALSLQIALDVWASYQNLMTAVQEIRTSEDLLANAEKSEQVALGRYKAGVGNILDVLNAQSALATARMQRIQSMLNWRVSRASLAKAMGSLDGRLLEISDTH